MKLVKLRALSGQVIAVAPGEVLLVMPSNDLMTSGLIMRSMPQQPIPVMGTSGDVADWLNCDRPVPPEEEKGGSILAAS